MRNERTTQNRIVQLLTTQLGYTYLGNWEDRAGNSNIEEEQLRNYLLKTARYSSKLIDKAILQLKKEATLSINDDLYTVNKEIYSRLRYGIPVKEEVGEPDKTVHFINWQQPELNDFAIAEEVTIKGQQEKRPDIVLYVNGIALGVLELKRASISATEGIRQCIGNQQHRFVAPFFTTIQVVLAGNDTQGLYYGTSKTSEKYFLKWKEDNHTFNQEQNILDQHVLQFCNHARLLDMVHNFIVFDGGKKKLCRPNQYFGIKEAQKYITRKEGGIIWHTQGSGKSLTMVWLAKWIHENITDARLLIVTDRAELDEQIEKVFKGVDETIVRTKSGQDLLNQLNNTKPWLLCSLIHKFGNRNDDDASEFIKQLSKPKDFKPKGNLFVFIDECHRTQSGDLHEAMKDIIPNAVFIGFTGTPLLKADKKKSIEIFGRYIHTYKFDEAIADNVVLDLLYEARDVDQHVVDQKGIDAWFDRKTAGMNDLPKAELKQKWGTMQKVLSTKSRLEKIVFDIITDFDKLPRLKDGKGNAMLVSRSIYEACRYYELFQYYRFKNCAIVTSFEPSMSSIKQEDTGEGETQKLEQYEIYVKMLNGKSREDFEKAVKKQFIDEPANMQLLIVVDKLLTGFDAPSCTYLYIDKEMQDHSLFQAICRVNRTENEDKEFGYIVDYKNLFNSLNKSITDYTSDAFDNFEEEDVKGLLVDRLEKAKDRLEDALETVHQLVEAVELPKQIEQYIKYFGAYVDDKDKLKDKEELRLTFYKSVVALIRAYNNIAPDILLAGYSEKEAANIKQQVNDYTELRNAIKIASGDDIDLKKFEPDMRQLLDMYLTADPSRTISNLGEATLLQLIVENGIEEATGKLPDIIKRSPAAMAETLEANMRRVITQEMPINPVYYEKMSTLLLELIRQRKEGAITYEKFLKEIEKLANNIHPKNSKDYPAAINTSGLRSFFDGVENNENLAMDVYDAINTARPDSWIGNSIKERKVRNAIREALEKHNIVDESEVTRLLELATKQNELQ